MISGQPVWGQLFKTEMEKNSYWVFTMNVKCTILYNVKWVLHLECWQKGGLKKYKLKCKVNYTLREYEKHY